MISRSGPLRSARRRAVRGTAVPVLLAVAALLPAATACEPGTARQPGVSLDALPAAIPDTAFARLVDDLSGEGGYFDTDNLISNERSYLHVLGALEERGVGGGAYIGVGPSQNFSYIAAVRPRLAFIVDIRRDNLLQHLLFKAIFHRSGSRGEWLALLLGREPPASEEEAWGIRELTRAIDATPRDTARERRARAEVRETVTSLGIPLSDDDLAYIDSVHRRFIAAGLSLRFRSHGREPRAYHPTFRQLLLETDLRGRHGNFLHDAEDFRFVEALQERNRVIPVVGDLAGKRALWAVGEEIARRGLQVSALYTSNVEFYLFRTGTMDRFLQNAASLPRNRRSVVIRSYFNRFRPNHPRSVPGYASTQLLQPLTSLAQAHRRGGYRGYDALLRDDDLELR